MLWFSHYPRGWELVRKTRVVKNKTRYVLCGTSQESFNNLLAQASVPWVRLRLNFFICSMEMNDSSHLGSFAVCSYDRWCKHPGPLQKSSVFLTVAGE